MFAIQAPEIKYVDPETGEVTSKSAYLAYLGADESFAINDQESLEWYMRKRLYIVAETETVKKQLKALLCSLDSQLRSLDFLFKEQAQNVARKLANTTGKQSVITPYGTCKFTKHGNSWVVDDEDQLQTWLRFLPEQDKLKYGVKPAVFIRNLDAIKQVAQTGVVVPGLKEKEAGETFSISYTKGEK